MCELTQASPLTVFVRKEACPVWAEAGNAVSGLGLVMAESWGWLRATGALRLRALGLKMSQESAITEWQLFQPELWSGPGWAALGQALRLFIVRGMGHRRVCVCVGTYIWVFIFGSEKVVDWSSVFLPCSLAKANRPNPTPLTQNCRDLDGSYLWYVCTHSTCICVYVYMNPLAHVYACIFMRAHQDKCIWLCVYVCSSVLGESLEYLSTD